MRILLRNFETGAFLKSAAHWATDQKDALNFECDDLAISVARELRLQNMELYLISDNSTPLSATRLKIDP